jgi:hypothetical protein
VAVMATAHFPAFPKHGPGYSVVQAEPALIYSPSWVRNSMPAIFDTSHISHLSHLSQIFFQKTLSHFQSFYRYDFLGGLMNTIQSTLSSLSSKTNFQEFYTFIQYNIKPNCFYYKSYITLIPPDFYRITISQNEPSSKIYLRIFKLSSADHIFFPFTTLEDTYAFIKRRYPHIFLKNMSTKQSNTLYIKTQHSKGDPYLKFKEKLFNKYLKTLPPEVRSNVEQSGWRAEDDRNQ